MLLRAPFLRCVSWLRRFSLYVACSSTASVGLQPATFPAPGQAMAMLPGHRGLLAQRVCTAGSLLLCPVAWHPGCNHSSSAFSPASAVAIGQAACSTRQLVITRAKVKKSRRYIPEGEFQPRLLTHKLQKAERIQQLQQLWDEHSQQFNSIHFSALMQQLAVLHEAAQTGRLPRGSNDAQEAEQLLLEWLSNDSTSSKPKQRQGRAAAQQPQHRERQQQHKQPEPSTPQRPEQPAELATAQQLAGNIAAAALQPGQREQLDGRALVMITHSLAKVGLGDSQLLHSIIQATGPHVLRRLDAQQLTNLIWSVAVCTLQSRHGQNSSRESSNSYASNGRGPDSNGSLPSAAALPPAGVAASSQRRFQLPYSWLAAAAAALQQQLDRCDSAGLAMALWGFAQVGFRPEDAWWSAFWSATQDRLSGYSGQDLSLVMYACGKLKAKVPDAWLASYLAASCAVLRSLSPQQLTMSLWGLAGAGCQPDKAWLMLWFLESKTNMHRAGTQVGGDDAGR
eukprot:GHUV01020986.1.p1 GENE.GHUV01020986.1~~GHUV01020986.1.p1  ORF type:complete len:509 (+),score=166.94 GHUV01020986.1:458-1984(+)